jgi:LysM repeat protein
VSPSAIAVHNGIANPSLIYPGQVLAIPNAYASVPAGPTCAAQDGAPSVPTGCGCVAYHTVYAGENLYRISLHHGVNMWHIARCNEIFNLHYIRVGDVLCIPDS